MDGLLLDRQHSQDVPVEVEPLIVRQDNFVTLKGPGVAQPASVEVYDVEGVVFKRRPRVGSHRFVVAIDLMDERSNVTKQSNLRRQLYIVFPFEFALS